MIPIGVPTGRSFGPEPVETQWCDAARSELPGRVVNNVRGIIGQSADDWLQELPAIVTACGVDWSCVFGEPFHDLSINYVVPGMRNDRVPVVLKVCIPNNEYLNEVAALQAINGEGANLLLQCNHTKRALLLERLLPGTPLDAYQDHDDAVRITSAVMRRIQRPLPLQSAFPSVDDWVTHMDQYRQIIRGTAFPMSWIDIALSLYRDLSCGTPTVCLLHGDLHEGNILAGQREPWMAIDPKGVVGPPVWETGPLLLNVINSGEAYEATKRNLHRCVDVLAEASGYDRQLITAWGVVRSVLSAFWTVEDHGDDWQSTLLTAGILHNM